MPRIIVTTDPSRLPDDAPVLLDERVHSVHLSSGHAAHQLIERLAWAINDAEESEGFGAAGSASPARRPRPTRATPTSPRSRVPRRRLPVGA